MCYFQGLDVRSRAPGTEERDWGRGTVGKEDRKRRRRKLLGTNPMIKPTGVIYVPVTLIHTGNVDVSPLSRSCDFCLGPTVEGMKSEAVPSTWEDSIVNRCCLNDKSSPLLSPPLSVEVRRGKHSPLTKLTLTETLCKTDREKGSVYHPCGEVWENFNSYQRTERSRFLYSCFHRVRKKR